VDFKYQHDLTGISDIEFILCPACSTIVEAAVTSFFGGISRTSTANISRVSPVPRYPTKQVRLLYTVLFHYTGNHDQFLTVAKNLKNKFVTSVDNGNFTVVLQRLAVDANVTILFNISSTSVTILDVDHQYNSLSPTVGPTRSPDNTMEFYEQYWFALSTFVILVCIFAGIVFTVGYFWRPGVARIHAQLQRVQEVYVQPKIDDVSSSDSESDTEEVF
jgi:heme/copper-type cytochrome/quinol oxidase subunit 2